MVYVVGMTLEELIGIDAEDDILVGFPYLLLEVDEDVLTGAGVPLNEARTWRPSSVKGLVYRVDPADEKLRQKRHVHVAASKHTAAKNRQVSWNDEGGRHDRHSFNAKLGTRADYREAARAALNLPPDAFLESVEPGGTRRLMNLTEELIGAEREERPLKFRVTVIRRTAGDDAVELGLPE